MSRERQAVRGARHAAARLVLSAFSAIPTFLWVAVGLIVALVVAVAVSGGLRAADATAADVAMGAEAQLSQYSVTVSDVEFTDAVEEQFMEAEPGDTLVVVTMTLKNATDRPIGVATSADRISTGFVNVREPLLALSGIEPTGSARAWRVDGSAGSVILQPGLSSTVKIAWPVPEDAVRSGSVQLEVHEARVSTGQILISSDQIFWRRGDLAARIDLGGAS